MIYPLVILIIVAYSAIRGFHRGMSRQVPDLIGTAFGIITARILAPGLQSILWGAFTSSHGTVYQTFVYDTMSTAILFFFFYFVFKYVTFFLTKVFKRGEHSILDNIGGSLFMTFKYLLMVSIVLNVILALSHDERLLSSAKSDDGNIVEVTLLLSPSVLGGEDVMELGNKVQLEEAKKIS